MNKKELFVMFYRNVSEESQMVIRNVLNVVEMNKVAGKKVKMKNYAAMIKKHKEIQKKTYDDICEMIAQENRMEYLESETLKKACRRNSQNSQIINDAISVLNISFYEQQRFNIISAMKRIDIEWIFDSKTESGQDIALELAKSLFLKESGSILSEYCSED